jgi:hypothetical protein
MNSKYLGLLLIFGLLFTLAQCGRLTERNDDDGSDSNSAEVARRGNDDDNDDSDSGETVVRSIDDDDSDSGETVVRSIEDTDEADDESLRGREHFHWFCFTLIRYLNF